MAKKSTKKKAGSALTKREPVMFDPDRPEDPKSIRAITLLSRTLSALVVAKSKLRDRKATTSSENELVYIEAKMLELNAEQQKVLAKITAFSAQATKVRPPTQAELNRMQTVVKTLGELVANATAARAIVVKLGEALQMFNEATSGPETELET